MTNLIINREFGILPLTKITTSGNITAPLGGMFIFAHASSRIMSGWYPLVGVLVAHGLFIFKSLFDQQTTRSTVMYLLPIQPQDGQLHRLIECINELETDSRLLDVLTRSIEYNKEEYHHSDGDLTSIIQERIVAVKEQLITIELEMKGVKQ